MRTCGAGRLAFVLSAVEPCELVPDMSIMPDFPNMPLIWINQERETDMELLFPSISAEISLKVTSQEPGTQRHGG